LDAFPARAPKAPSPAHAAPVTAPEIAPLNAPSAILPETNLHLSRGYSSNRSSYQSSGHAPRMLLPV